MYRVPGIPLPRNSPPRNSPDIDIPFVQDGTRDGEHIRYTMHKRFEAELKKRNKPYILLSGNHQTRLKEAIEACDQLLKVCVISK